MIALHIHFEGSVSQILYLGPRVPRPITLFYTFLVGMLVPTSRHPDVGTKERRRPVVPILHICSIIYFGRYRLTSYFSS